MLLALEEATQAFDEGEVPIGCVIVNRNNNEIIARTHNSMQQHKNACLHAEMKAIELACKKSNNKNLSNCDIYVTLEPCTMCAAAISYSRISRLYYSTPDPKQGAVENGVRFYASESCMHKPEVYSGMNITESSKLMKSFFIQLRKNKL